MQINLSKLKTYGLRILPWALLLICFSVAMCNGSKNSESVAFLKREVKVRDGKLSALQKKGDSLDAAFAQKDDSLKVIKAANAALQTKVRKLNEETSRKLAHVDKMRGADFVAFFADRYKMPDQVSESSSGVCLSDTLARPVVGDLITGDAAQAELALTTIELANERKAGRIKDTMLQNRDEKVRSVLDQNSLLKSDSEASRAIIEDQEIDIKRMTKQNAFLKLGIPVGIGLGFLAGVMLAH